MTTAPPSVKRNSIFTQPIHSPRARWESLLHSPTSALGIFTPHPLPRTRSESLLAFTCHPAPSNLTPRSIHAQPNPSSFRKPPPHLRKPRMHPTPTFQLPPGYPHAPGTQSAVPSRYSTYLTPCRLGSASEVASVVHLLLLCFVLVMSLQRSNAGGGEEDSLA